MAKPKRRKKTVVTSTGKEVQKLQPDSEGRITGDVTIRRIKNKGWEPIRYRSEKFGIRHGWIWKRDDHGRMYVRLAGEDHNLVLDPEEERYMTPLPIEIDESKFGPGRNPKPGEEA